MSNNRLLSVAASVLLTVSLGVGLVGIASINAQIPEMPEMPSAISGAYVNADAGVEIAFPEGWEGLEVSVGGSTIASVYPGGLEGMVSGEIPSAMTLIVSNKAEVEEPDPSEPPNVPEDSTVQCEAASVSNVNVADVNALQSVIECTVDGIVIKTKTIMVDTEARWIVLSFIAPTTQYDEHIDTVDISIATLRVDGALDAEDVSDGIIDLPSAPVDAELTALVQSVIIDGEDIEVSIRSSSTVRDFWLDEENNRLSFMVEGPDGTEGTTEISIGRILEGPYTVTIDGEVTTDFEVTSDTITGEVMITISYTHSVHEIVITGTNVVPEFHIAVMGIIAAIIGVVAFITRTRLVGNVTGYKL